MDQLYSWLHYTFKDISNNTSHAQIRVKMKKLWHQQVGEEKQAAEQKLFHDISRFCHDKANNKAINFFATNPDYVITKQEDSFFFFFCRNKVFLLRKFFYRDKFFLLQQSFSIVTKFFLLRQSFSVATKFLCRDKVFFMSRH